MSTGWTHSMKQAGAYFKLPGRGSSWTQEHKGVSSEVIREAVRLTWRYWDKTIKRLDEQAKRESALVAAREGRK